MRKQKTFIVCDACGASALTAVVTCEVHTMDLCETHMRKHFDKSACRLVPVDREPTSAERTTEILDKLRGRLDTPTDAMNQSSELVEDMALHEKPLPEEEPSARFYWSINGVPACKAPECDALLRQHFDSTVEVILHSPKPDYKNLADRFLTRCGHETRESVEKDVAKVRKTFPKAIFEIIEGQCPYSR